MSGELLIFSPSFTIAIPAVPCASEKLKVVGSAAVPAAGPDGTMCRQAPLPSLTAKNRGTRLELQNFQLMLPVLGAETRMRTVAVCSPNPAATARTVPVYTPGAAPSSVSAIRLVAVSLAAIVDGVAATTPPETPFNPVTETVTAPVKPAARVMLAIP